MLSFLESLRLPEIPRAAFVGAGGKTTAIFTLAHQLPTPVIVTATTHMGNWELKLADRLHILREGNSAEIRDVRAPNGVTLIIGPEGENNRHHGLNEQQISELVARKDLKSIPLLIEADGSHKRPLKAPAAYEPVIPEFVNVVIVVAGMNALWKPLSKDSVHRIERFSRLTHLAPGELITPEGIVRLLKHPSGGLKNIPKNARKILLLNQADTITQQKAAQYMAQKLLTAYESVIIGSLNPAGNPDLAITRLPSIETIDLELPSSHWFNSKQVTSVHERIAGIVLAAGESSRFGGSKLLLDWNGEPLIRQIVKTALDSGLQKVIVVTGAYAEDITPTLVDLPVVQFHNPRWHEGQSSSIRLGLENLDEDTNGVIFFLADQPYLSKDLIQALVVSHSLTLAAIIAPIVENQRGNPVLFDRVTFPVLNTLSGDQGGRFIFDRFTMQFVKWDDSKILLDIDTQEDFRTLKQKRDE